MAAEVDQKGSCNSGHRSMPCELLSSSSPSRLSWPFYCYGIAVVVHVRSTGDAPILKQSKFKVRIPSPHHPSRLLVIPPLNSLAVQHLFYSRYSWKLGFHAFVSRSRLQNRGLLCLTETYMRTSDMVAMHLTWWLFVPMVNSDRVVSVYQGISPMPLFSLIRNWTVFSDI